MGSISDRILENMQGDGLSMTTFLLVLVIAGLLANGYAELLRRKRLRETHGVDDMLPY